MPWLWTSADMAAIISGDGPRFAVLSGATMSPKIIILAGECFKSG